MLSDWTNLTSHLEASLTRALERSLDNWFKNQSASQRALENTMGEENFRNAAWYIVVMVGIFTFIMVAILVSTVKSKRREHSDDPYHKYIEEDWTAQVHQSYVLTNPTASAEQA